MTECRAGTRGEGRRWAEIFRQCGTAGPRSDFFLFDAVMVRSNRKKLRLGGRAGQSRLRGATAEHQLGQVGRLSSWLEGQGFAGSSRSFPENPPQRGGAQPLGHLVVAAEDPVQLPARSDAELRENLAQVVLDGAPAYE